MKLRDLALAAGGLAAGYALERAVLGRTRHRPDPEVLAEFRPPDDAVHHHLPSTDGGELHVLERGPLTPGGESRHPLVFLHGITLSSLAWHYQVASMADRFRVLAVDHRGHGRSTPGTGEWGLERIAIDIHEVLEALDLRHAVLVGHSMGGMAVLRFAVDHPGTLADRVAGLVLMSTACRPVNRLAAWRALTELVTPPARRSLALADRRRGGLFPSSDLTHLIFRLGMGPGASATHVELNRLMTAATPLDVWGELIAEVVGFDVGGRLDTVDVPATVFVGTRDLLTPPSAARAIVERLPKAELEVFPGAGHMLMLERPDDVAARIERFVSGLP